MRTLVAIVCGLGLAALLAACQDLPAPKTPAQNLAAAEVAFTAVVEGLTSARDAGLIERGSATAASIGEGIMTARAALDATHAAVAAGDTQSVAGWLTVARGALAELQRILAAARTSGPASALPSTAPPAVSLVPGFSLFADAGVAP